MGSAVVHPSASPPQLYAMARSRRTVEVHCDLVNGASSLVGFASSVSGGTVASQTVVAGQIGLARYSTGTTASANQRAAIATALTQYIPGSGEMAFYCDVTPQANFDAVTNTGFAMFGLSNTVGSLGSNGAYFYSDNGGNLFARSVSGGTSTGTLTNSNVAFTVGAARQLEIRINAAGTAVSFFIDGALIVTHSSNITATACGFVSSLVRSSSTAYAALFDQSYIGFRVITTNARFP